MACAPRPELRQVLPQDSDVEILFIDQSGFNILPSLSQADVKACLKRAFVDWQAVQLSHQLADPRTTRGQASGS